MERTWTIKDILLWSSDYLKSNDSDTARLDSELIMSQALNCSRIDLYCHYDKPVNELERQRIRESLQKRAKGEPIAYILGEKDFYGRSFKVSPSVLIPRPETEHLVEEVLKVHASKPISNFLEVGAGSGCISLTLAKEISGLCGESWDISAEAIAVAEANARLHEVESICFKERDALAFASWQGLDLKYDLICSNPPYISRDEISIMGRSVLDYEPELALFAEDEGLVFYKTMANLAKGALSDNGTIVLEIGAYQGEKVRSIFESESWSDTRVVNDLAGHPRIVIASK